MSAALIRTAYRSQAARPELALLSLAEIIAVSDRNNRRDELTGALLVSRGRFFQVLEGAAVDVDRALGRIAADARHFNLDIVSRLPCSHRLFEGWAMVAAQVSPSVAMDIDRAIDACHDDPDRAIHAVVELVRHQQA